MVGRLAGTAAESAWRWALPDELALRFVQEGLSIKQMIRAMVLTDAFQRSTVPRAAVKQKDPQNISFLVCIIFLLQMVEIIMSIETLFLK